MTARTDASGTTQFSWDVENRLTQVTKADGIVVTFKYDPFGRRIQKSSASATINYAYHADGLGSITSLTAADRSTLNTYTVCVRPTARLTM
jgi:YD repeat-containing protein